MARPKRPAPLTPPGCDLRALPNMPLDVRRLLRSSMMHEQGEVFRAAFVLWCAAWHENPAGSVKADDQHLASKLGYRANPEAWTSLKERALAGFVLCSDGRYYHRIISELALDAWGNYLTFARRSAAGNARKYGRNFDTATIDAQLAELPKYRDRLKKMNAGLETYDGRPPLTAPSGSEAPTRKSRDLLVGGNGIGSKEEETQSRPLPIRRGQRTSSTPGATRTKVRVAAAVGGDARGTRLPISWFPSAELRKVGTDLGFTDPEVDEIADEFRDYWSAKPGKDGRKLDWDATWRNWVRKERRHRDARGTRTGAGRRGSAFDTEALGPMHAGFVAAVDKARR